MDQDQKQDIISRSAIELRGRSRTRSPGVMGLSAIGLASYMFMITLFIILSIIILTPAASAYHNSGNIISVSGFGYHPLQSKQAIVYTSQATGTLTIYDASTNAAIATYTLSAPKDASGKVVKCQGGLSCLTADFSSLKSEGRYYASVFGASSEEFIISESVFKDRMPILLEFYNAMLQQGSAYHADMHAGYDPALSSMADGSFIMHADQAALPLIRMANAYSINPSLFQTDEYDIIGDSIPDMQEYIVSYVDYLEGLQGLEVRESTGEGFRLNPATKIVNAFVPGPTSLKTLDVYAPGNPPHRIDTVNVVSLCGADDGSSAWDECIAHAATYYKCQIDEPCLNITYQERRGVIGSHDNGYAVSSGWGYEFGCYVDIDLAKEQFGDGYNPCLIFYPETSREYTSMTLLAFLKSMPALSDYSSSKASEVLTRSINTYEYIQLSYPDFNAGESDAGFFGAASFLLYDNTGEIKYLQQAHSMRGLVRKEIIADRTRAEELYWEEYAKHKKAILDAGLSYEIDGDDPAGLFTEKISYDYSGRFENPISSTGERVYQLSHDIKFQNSRFMLLEAIYAAKSRALDPAATQGILSVADMQLAWLTGMNAVQKGTSEHPQSIASQSFIFGIGNDPEEFHSRYLVDTGYSSASEGTIIGARGTGYMFRASDLDIKNLSVPGPLENNSTRNIVQEQAITKIPTNIDDDAGDKNTTNNTSNNSDDVTDDGDGHIGNATDNNNTTKNNITDDDTGGNSTDDDPDDNKLSLPPGPNIKNGPEDNVTTKGGGANNIDKNGGNTIIDNTIDDSAQDKDQDNIISDDVNVIRDHVPKIAIDLYKGDKNMVVAGENTAASVGSQATMKGKIISADSHAATHAIMMLDSMMPISKPIAAPIANPRSLPSSIISPASGPSENDAQETQDNAPDDKKNNGVEDDAGGNGRPRDIMARDTPSSGILDDGPADNTIDDTSNDSSNDSSNDTPADDTDTISGSQVLSNISDNMGHADNILYEQRTRDMRIPERKIILDREDMDIGVIVPTEDDNSTGTDDSANNSSADNDIIPYDIQERGAVERDEGDIQDGSDASREPFVIDYTPLDTQQAIVSAAADEYIYLDGRSVIMGRELGAMGNKWRSEKETEIFRTDKTFSNGNAYIPGWINGVYDTDYDADSIFNYDDTVNTYEFTETTNEIVAAAVELAAYLDLIYSNKSLDGANSSGGGNVTPGNTTLGNATITSHSTNLNASSSDPNIHMMYETGHAIFNVLLDNASGVEWLIDDKIARTDSAVMNSTLSWDPGILWSSNTRRTTITARTGSDEASFIVDIVNVINPFFSSTSGSEDILGSKDTQLHIFTQNSAARFTALNATIYNPRSGQYTAYSLENHTFSQDTDWRVNIADIGYGDNYLVSISGYDNTTGKVTDYTLDNTTVGHYRDVPASSGGSGRGGGGGSGGSRGGSSGGTYTGSTTPELVYVRFLKDVLSDEESQQIMLDAKNFGGGVSNVSVELLSPDNRTLTLGLLRIDGTKEYGTWAAELGGLSEGKYILSKVILFNAASSSASPQVVDISNRSFYVTSELHTLPLTLIYSFLSTDIADPGKTIYFTLDATDNIGISNVTANVTTTNGKAFSIDLELISGTPTYGTWSGSFKASEADTTYTIRSVGLQNKNSTRVYEIDNRSAYIRADNTTTPRDVSDDVALFSPQYFSQLIKRPLFPVAIALIIVLVIGAGISILYAARNNGNKGRRKRHAALRNGRNKA